MQRHEILAQLKALKLFGMAAAFDEVIDEGIKRSRPPFEVLARLLQAEYAERHARSVRYQMSAAKFPMCRDLDSFEFHESPVNEQQIRALYDGQFLEDKRHGWHRHREVALGRGYCNACGSPPQARALLRRARSGEPVGAGEAGGQARQPGP
jgi:hypothetical protein